MTLLPDQGIWLTDADGRTLASILSADPDPYRPGCVRVHVMPHQSNGEWLVKGTGAWRVQDRQTDQCFCIQALSCTSTGRGYDVMVSTLGQPTDEPVAEDDDYLVVPGHDPVALGEVLIADGQCPCGPHIRCELPTERFASLPFEAACPRRCGCGRSAGLIIAKEDSDSVEADFGLELACNGTSHSWRFANLIGDERPGQTPNRASIVRLRQRLILDCHFHIVMLEAPGVSSTTVCIGHVCANQRWHRRSD